MKNLVSLLLISVMLFPTLSLAAKERKDCPECMAKTNAAQEEKINRVCNDVSDIICKDVKAEERRSCDEADSTIFNKNTTKMDLFNFAKGCFKSGVTSFTQFFTDFIPELLKGIWEANKAAYSLVAKSFTSSDEPGLWSKLKGMYESTASVAADVYEAVQENPGAYFDKIWSKVVDVVGPMVAGYDCLKPQRKVEKICGFVAEWVVPPAMLAKILVRGIKEVKFLKEAGVFSMSSSGKLAKALDYAEKRSLLSLKQLQEMEIQFKSLGYTRDEFALIYKNGSLDKLNIAELKSLATAEGKAQKAKLLGEAKATTAAATTATVAQVAPKKPAPSKPVPAKLELTTDFITTTKTGSKGEKLVGNGQIVERIISDGKEVGYRVRMVEGDRVFETVYSAADLAAMNAKNATKGAAQKIADAVSKDKKFASPDSEFAALQKKQDVEHARAMAPDNLNMVDVKEVGMDDFLAAQRAQVKAAADAKAAREASAAPVKVDGMDVHETGMEEFHKAGEALKQDAVAKAKALEAAEKKRITDQGVVERDGMAMEEIHPDDPRFKAIFSGKAPEVQPRVEYPGGIDFVETQVPGQIIRTKDRVPTQVKPIKEGTGKPIAGAFQSDYIQVMTKNSMGVTTFMPAQIIKKVFEDRTEKYLIRMLDKASNTYKEKLVTLPELKLQMRAKEAPRVEKEIKDFNRQTGFQDDLN